MKNTDIKKTALQVLKMESRAIARLSSQINKDFEKAVEWMSGCKGRVILTGMGKPGFIARKIAATLASTGTPSMYLHPAEAVHGDLGMVTKKDIIIAISQSGETEEIIRLLTTLKRKGIPLIALTSMPKSTLGKNASIVLDLGVRREACPLNLAPSTSTTASLAMGDALALCLLEKKGFRSEDFAELHPGGSLGKKLLRVKDIMRTGKANPVVKVKTQIKKVLLVITSARAGSCTIINNNGKLHGIFTDGDLRRHLRGKGKEILNQPVENFATLKPKSINKEKLAEEALNILQSSKIDEIPVVDDAEKVVGLLDIQDILKAGLI